MDAGSTSPRLDGDVWSGRRLVSCTVACLLLTVGAGGCKGDDDDDSAGPDESLYTFEMETELSDLIPTVATVQWSVDAETVEDASVTFGLDGDFGQKAITTANDDGSYTSILLGMKASTEYTYRAVVVVEGETHTSESSSLVTGQIPPDLPVFEVPVHDEERMTPGFYTTSVIGGPPPTVIILDSDGDIVWWYQDMDQEFLVTVVRLTVDRQRMLYLGTYSGDIESGNEERYLVWVNLDGTGEEMLQVPGAHHDIELMEDGTVAVIRSERQECGDANHEHGTQIIEIGPDGTEELIWSAWDHFECVYDETTVGGWTHGNALDYDPVEEVYYLSLRAFDSILKIDRWTGEILWIMGGDLSDFATGEGETSLYVGQHQFQVLDGSIVVFDNGSIEDNNSRAVEYAFDETSFEVEDIWNHSNDPALYCYSLGDVTRLPSGNTLITWGPSGQLNEVTPQGEVVWQVNTPLANGLGYVEWTPSF